MIPIPSKPSGPGVGGRRQKRGAGVEVTDRDRAILGLFADLRFVETHQLQHLLTPRFFPSRDALHLRLGTLRRAGYLALPAKNTRPTYQLHGRPAHRPENIWAITTKGARAINLAGDWDKNNRRLRDYYSFQHPLLISEIYTTLRLGEPRCGFTVASWHGENAWRDRVDVYSEGRRLALPVSPDALFVLEDRDYEREYFLEVDCHTEPLTRSDWQKSSFFKKAIGYQHFWKRESARDPDFARLVLTVAKTEARAESLRATAALADPRGKGLNLFYFTSCERWSLEDPGRFFTAKIWTTAAGEKRLLLD